MCEKRQVAWQRSTRCGTNACVEVATVSASSTPEEIRVRDSKDPLSPELAFDATAWRTFIEGVKNGDLDRR
ncbi:hypothetical protein Vau01_075000 [Virgisporangium aurantiacum]|uniref:DUF397 domain-containing protein n=2 Tax=Virgisporangium aurantiacum TaxID=175570 RepID=A0A8J3Z9Q9_9ACTN|nr:hypothetical protein Vau01_075000 [Virgisporangium aurantiacum]